MVHTLMYLLYALSWLRLTQKHNSASVLYECCISFSLCVPPSIPVNKEWLHYSQSNVLPVMFCIVFLIQEQYLGYFIGHFVIV